MKLSSPTFFVVIVIIVAVLMGFGIAVYFSLSPTKNAVPPVNPGLTPGQQIAKMQDGCLRADEEAEYKLINEKGAEDSAVIIVKDKNTRGEQRRFTIPIQSATHYHPIELHPCGVYAMRQYNYDYSFGKPLPNYKDELWKYDYGGRGYLLMALYDAERPAVANYSNDFRIDPTERYLVLAKGFAGSSDGLYDIVFKDTKTMADVFVLPVSEVWGKYPYTIPGSSVGFEAGGWTKDGRYFWANFFVGAPVLGYIRIDSTNWTYELFKAPPDVLGGDQLNLETGWLTVHPGNVWFGVSKLTEEEKAKRRAQGIGTELYIHNLITAERRFVVSTTEPLWYFRPNWLSDTELEYTLPSGEKKIFKVE